MLACIAAASAALIALSPATIASARADSSDDVAFITTLDWFKVPYPGTAQAIQQAKALCLFYAVNDAFFERGAIEILKYNPDYTIDDAAHFAGAATAIYCPEHGPR